MENSLDPRKRFKEWVDKYEEKTGEKAILPPGYVLQFLPSRGWSTYKIDTAGSMLVVYQSCGDLKFWRDVAELIASTNKLKCICTSCLLDIEAYIRFFGGKIVEKQEHNGQFRYICKDYLGRKVIATYRGNLEKTGKPCYWVTQYLYELLETKEDR